MDSYYKERCLPGRQILSPTETDFVSHGDKFEFVSQGDKFCPRARPCFQRNCGAEEWTASRCQPRGGARAGPLAERIMRRSKARPQRRYRSSLARFVVRSRLDTEKVQALLQEVTELEREVARAHARSRRGNQADGGG